MLSGQFHSVKCFVRTGAGAAFQRIFAASACACDADADADADDAAGCPTTTPAMRPATIVPRLDVVRLVFIAYFDNNKCTFKHNELSGIKTMCNHKM